MSKYAPHHKSNANPKATSSTVCQKCLKRGHYLFECKSTRPYVSRPSRTEQLENPRVLAKLRKEGKASVEVPEEFTSKIGTANRILEAKEKEREQVKGKEKEVVPNARKRVKRSSRSGSSSSSSSDSDSDSSSDSNSMSNSSGSDSESDRERRRRKPSRRSRSKSMPSE